MKETRITILIIILILSIINTSIVMSKKAQIIINPDNNISDCRGISYYGNNHEKEKQDCLENIEKQKTSALKAEQYLEKNKKTHTIIAYILTIVSLITLITSLKIPDKKGSLIALSIFVILINILVFYGG